MKLFNVRKGQFVYYKNQLHKVYAIRPFFKHSVHLIRLNDFTQHFVTAKDIVLYYPKHMDSFIFNYERYTLHKDMQANVGDYILVVNPRPDSLDHHHLHAIEMVVSIEKNGVISHKMNGIKHIEYWVMSIGILDGASKIDLQNPNSNQDNEQMDSALPEKHTPRIGDVYQSIDSDTPIRTMVLAIQNDSFYLGGEFKVSKEDLNDPDKWEYLFNVIGR